jgi:hypothetical protein
MIKELILIAGNYALSAHNGIERLAIKDCTSDALASPPYGWLLKTANAMSLSAPSGAPDVSPAL